MRKTTCQYCLLSAFSKELRLYYTFYFIAAFFIFFSCISPEEKPLFTQIKTTHSGITFINQVDYTEEFNAYTYRNFYNGAGVGFGDFNNDGLTDIYFCGNMVDNKLYINKGNFVFEDMTDKAGVACKGSWSTGVSIADITGDGLPDIYVCKSGKPDTQNRRNTLFINNGDLTFTEKAGEFGLDVLGMSNHAAFFDYDLDGDLDCYLLNNSFQSVTEFDMKPGQRAIRDTLGANMLFRNDNGHFIDVSSEAGIYGSKIGFGLGVSVADINRDGWPDIYVSNDFFERDYLYINNHNGTFTESLEEQIRETSLGAMGSDIADINNDAYPEIFVTEMTPEGNSRYKTKTLFEDWNRYREKIRKGYYRQFARNTLQLNNRNGSFSEIGRFSGVDKTDWSWGALIMDLDNDGWKDIFVANGIYKDLLDRDFLDIYSEPSVMRTLIKTEEKAILGLIDRIPSVKVSNYAFCNNHDLTFSNLSEKWGLATPSWSNGAAYGDLDNDGDLDLVVNNVNMPPFIYRNEASGRNAANFLEIKLIGTGLNTSGEGASASIYYGGNIEYNELQLARGFMSTVDSRLHFGVGTAAIIDSLVVRWPDGKYTIRYDIASNQIITLNQNERVQRKIAEISKTSPVFMKTVLKGLEFIHNENDFNDFERDRLLFRMVSDEGPHIAAGDVNNDGLTDIYMCGAKDSPGELFVQSKGGTFERTNLMLFVKDKISEDTDCAFFDADNDGDQDLYVASGGNEFPSASSALADRLYLNDGKGNFSKSPQLLPSNKYESTSCVEPADFDNDGDIDLFVGIRLLPFEYGLPANGYLLENDGKGNFKDVTQTAAPGLIRAGMITGMKWADVDNDSDPDMVLIGDWMPVRILINENGKFNEKTNEFGLNNSAGIWHTITSSDINGDGYIDFVLGNEGMNTGFHSSEAYPMEMYVNDFDLNGNVEQVICQYNGSISYPVALKDDIVKQIPFLQTKYRLNDDYKNKTISEIFPEDVLKRSLVLRVNILQSCVMINSGKGTFKLIPLPVETQLSPVYAVAADDFDHDGFCDIILGGNQYRAKPQTGINDASYGLFLKGNGNSGWKTIYSKESGINVTGAIRDFTSVEIAGKKFLLVAKNNDSLITYRY